MSISRSVFASLVCVSLAGATGCTEPPKPKKSPPKPQTEQTDPGPEVVAAPDAAPGPGGDAGGVSDPAQADPLGSRLKDPSWYTPDIIEHEKIIQNGRSEAQTDGTFSSALVLQLTAGTTAEDCVQTLVGKAEPSGLSFGEAETGADGRLTARAEDDRMRVTFVCGVVKGVPTAFVGYEWKPGA